MAGVTILSWSRVQQAVSLSSYESELYAMSACAADMLYVRSLLQDLGMLAGCGFPCVGGGALW